MCPQMTQRAAGLASGRRTGGAWARGRAGRYGSWPLSARGPACPAESPELAREDPGSCAATYTGPWLPLASAQIPRLPRWTSARLGLKLQYFHSGRMSSRPTAWYLSNTISPPASTYLPLGPNNGQRDHLQPALLRQTTCCPQVLSPMACVSEMPVPTPSSHTPLLPAGPQCLSLVPGAHRVSVSREELRLRLRVTGRSRSRKSTRFPPD